MSKINTWSFYSFYIFTLQSLPFSRSISRSHCLYHTLSLIGQFSCYFLGTQIEFNRSLSLALYLTLALAFALTLALAFAPHRSGRLIFLLFSRQPNRFSTQIFYYSPSDQVSILFLSTSLF